MSAGWTQVISTAIKMALLQYFCIWINYSLVPNDMINLSFVQTQMSVCGVPHRLHEHIVLSIKQMYTWVLMKRLHIFPRRGCKLILRHAPAGLSLTDLRPDREEGFKYATEHKNTHNPAQIVLQKHSSLWEELWNSCPFNVSKKKKKFIQYIKSPSTHSYFQVPS